MADRRAQPRRTTRPLTSGVQEAVDATLDLAERVTESAAYALRRRPAAPGEGPARGPRRAGRAPAGAAEPAAAMPAGRAGGRGSAADLIGEVAGIFAELLDRAGEAAQEVAASIGEQEWAGADYEACPQLEVRGVAAGDAAWEFRFTNTGSSALDEVGFVATELIGSAGSIDAGQIRFEPEQISRLGPAKSEAVKVIVRIPEGQTEGTYRGLIQARAASKRDRAAAEAGPEGAWALLRLEVAATGSGRAISPVERSEAS